MNDNVPICLVMVRSQDDPRNLNLDHTYDIRHAIETASAEHGFVCRFVDARELGSESQDSELYRQLSTADVVVVDTAAESADYMYLMGARQALSKAPTIVVAHKGHELPFDVSGQPVVRYDSIASLRQEFDKHLQRIHDKSWQSHSSYSPIRKALDDVPDVFLSYAHKDKEAVLAVDQWLRDKGARVNIDERDFIAGRDIRDEIVRFLSLAGKVVCFYSQSSADRYYTQLERRIVEEREQQLHTSKNRAALLLYFRLDDSDLPLESSSRLAINAWQMSFSEACEDLWRHILEQSAEPTRVDLTKYTEIPPWG